MNFTRIVYLDPSLISEAYTEITGASPITRVTRSQEVAGKASAGVFGIAGTTRESREFAVSTTQMFNKIEKTLREYPVRESLSDTAPVDPFWVRGFLGVGAHSQTNGPEVLKELYQFMISDAERVSSKLFCLATNDSYFTSGYDQFAEHKDMLSYGMWEPVEALLRPLFHNERLESSLFSPFVILHV